MQRALLTSALAIVAFVPGALAACGGRVEADDHPPPSPTTDTTTTPPRPRPREDAGPDPTDPTHRIISTSDRSFLEAETSLARSSDGALAAAWIAVSEAGASDIGYAFSRDDGATWTTPAFVGDANGRDSSDPVVTVDAQGNFYVAWISFRRSGNDAYDFVLYVAKAAKGASAFATPVTVDTFPSGDKPWIKVSAAGTLLVTYEKGGASGGELAIARSTDGASWTKGTVTTFGADGLANFVVTCPGATRVWATYLDATSGGDYAFRLRWSDDDGVTWPAENVGTVAAPGATSAPAIEPPSCTASGSDVWVGYGMWTGQPADQESPPDELHVAHSQNGTTFVDVRATDGATKASALGDLVSEAPGVLSLAYYAGEGNDDPKGSVRRVRSSDGGKTWDKSQTLQEGVYFTTDRQSARWLGDYLGSAATPTGKLYVAFGDNATGATTHIGFAKLP